MAKRLALVLVALLVVPLLVTACSTASRDTAADYINALMKGDDQKALDLACESFQEGTQTLLAWYRDQNIHTKTIDLKFDIGKATNEKEIIVTGAYEYGDEELPREYELSEKLKTRIVLWMEKDGDDWCVGPDSEFLGTPLAAPAAEE